MLVRCPQPQLWKAMALLQTTSRMNKICLIVDYAMTKLPASPYYPIALFGPIMVRPCFFCGRLEEKKQRCFDSIGLVGLTRSWVRFWPWLAFAFGWLASSCPVFFFFCALLSFSSLRTPSYAISSTPPPTPPWPYRETNYLVTFLSCRTSASSPHKRLFQ